MLRRQRRHRPRPVSAQINLVTDRLETLENRILLAATPLASGETVQALISTPGEIDEYEFTASAGDAMQLNFSRTAGPNYNLRVQIYGPDGNPLDGGGVVNTSAAFTFDELPASGRYTVTVNSPDGISGIEYALTLFKTPGPQTYEANEAGQLTSGTAKTGRIALGDIDSYFFDATADDAAQFSFSETSPGSPSLRVQVYDPDGNELPDGDRTGVSGNFTFDNLPATGRYTVTIRSWNGRDAVDYLLQGSYPAGQGLPIVEVTVDHPTVPEDGPGVLRYTFTRSGNTAGSLAVNFRVTGSAVAGSDYYTGGAAAFNGRFGVMTFAAGEASKVFLVSPADDAIAEPHENVRVDIISGNGYRIGARSGVGAQILNDDQAMTVSIAVDRSAVFEDGPGVLRYTFTRAGSAAVPLTVNFRVTGTAVAGNDYYTSGATTFNGQVGTIVFAAGQTSRVFVVSPADGTVVEPHENVRVDITSGNGYSIGAPSGAGALIQDDDPTPTINVAVDRSAAFEDGPGVLRYTFTRAGSAAVPLTVNFRVTGTAIAGNDYYTGGANSFNGRFGTIVFAAGQTSRVFVVSPADDAIAEPHENVRVDIAAGSGYVVGPSSGAGGLILDDDSSPTINVSVDRSAVFEDGPAVLRYTFTRTGSTATEMYVNFRTSGLAEAGQDYLAEGAVRFNSGFGAMLFEAGQSSKVFTVSPIDDTVVEPHENVRVDITSGTGYLIGPNSGVGAQILNDDAASSPPTSSQHSITALTSQPIIALSAAATTAQVLPLVDPTHADDLTSHDLPAIAPQFIPMDWQEIAESLLEATLV